MANTRIEWAERVWNPVTGCTSISEGCQNCYAERMSKRLAGRCGYPKDNPFQVTFHPDKLDEPLRPRKPSRIFVCSMGDLFHEDVPDEWLDQVFAMMARASQHIFLVLTKRPERMRNYILKAMYDENCHYQGWYEAIEKLGIPDASPMENIWLGATAENQPRFDERVNILTQIPAAKRFISIEPMLSEINMNKYLWDYYDQGLRRPLNKIDWVICGGETGPGARPMHPKWVRSLRDQCQATGTAFFFKSWGDWCPSWYGAQSWEPDHNTPFYFFDSPPIKTWRIGKKKAGRLLDGKEWSEYPGVRV